MTFKLQRGSVGEKVAHRISIAILDIDFCPMGDQQVDDFTVAIPGCQHQTGHLRPEKDKRQESKEEMMTKHNGRQGNKEKTKNRREATIGMVRKLMNKRKMSEEMVTNGKNAGSGQDESRPEETRVKKGMIKNT